MAPILAFLRATTPTARSDLIGAWTLHEYTPHHTYKHSILACILYSGKFSLGLFSLRRAPKQNRKITLKNLDIRIVAADSRLL